MLLKNLLESINYQFISGNPSISINGIASDSRLVNRGDLFVAIPGQKSDGHQFIEEALKGGVRAVVGEKEVTLPNGCLYVQVKESRKALADLACKFYGHPTKKLFTVGVTGTNGKTTVTHLAREVLGYEKSALISTISLEYEDRTSSIVTTPTAPQIQKIALSACKSGKVNLVLEASSHGLHQERVRGVDFDVSVFTNLTQDHFDYHANFDHYFKAKSKLFSYLETDDWAILNVDDPYGHAIATKTKAQIFTYGIQSEEADLKADKIDLGPSSSRFRVIYPRGELEVETKLPGKFNVYNTLAAFGVGIIKDIPIGTIKSRIENLRSLEGRCESFKAKGGFTVVVDFAHTPDALKQVIEALKPHYRRVITIFGCGGDSDKKKRPIMGEVSGSLSDYTIITTDNPKGESPNKIAEEIEEGIGEVTGAYDKIMDRKEAIKAGLSLAWRGDCVLIAGKGHEQTQEFKDRKIKFNDKEFLKKLGVLTR